MAGRALLRLILAATLVATACSDADDTVAVPESDAATTTAASPATNPTTTSSTTSTTTATTAPPATTTTTTGPPVDVARLARGVLMVGMPLTYVDEAATAHLTAGGRAVILFSENISDAAQLRTLTSDVACAANAPVLIAVDHEIGAVARLEGLVTALPSGEEALTMGPGELRDAGSRLGAEMLGLGINVDLAPVLDVVRGPNPALEDRHLGDDPDVVAELGTAFLTGLADAGVGAVAKHFPGHGLTPTDPHGETSVIEAGLDELRSIDWLPFRRAVDAGVPAVMIGHPIYTAIDPTLPASLSPEVYRLLRAELGFRGVAVTDAINMAAVAESRAASEIALDALVAGADLLINPDWSQTEPTVATIVSAVARGELPLERLVEAAGRVEAWAATVGRIDCARSAGT